MSFTADTINRFYGLDGPFDFVGVNHKVTRTTPGLIINTFCNNQLTAEEVHAGARIPERKLDLRLAPLVDLYKSKFNPTTHTGSYTEHQIYTLYRILAGCNVEVQRRINVGVVIEKAINSRDDDTKKPYCYPGLITQHCMELHISLG